MSKRKSESGRHSDLDNSNSDNSSSASDSEFLSLANKKRNLKTTDAAAGLSLQPDVVEPETSDRNMEHSSDSSSGSDDASSDSDSQSDDNDDDDAAAATGDADEARSRKSSTRSEAAEEGQLSSDDDDANPASPDKDANAASNKSSAASSSSSSSSATTNDDDDDDDEDDEDNDGGSARAASESESESEFNDGYDDDLMGDTADRSRLESLSEKERETEIFKRIERRDVMKTRWEIERKLKLAKRAQRTTSAAQEPAAVIATTAPMAAKRAINAHSSKAPDTTGQQQHQHQHHHHTHVEPAPTTPNWTPAVPHPHHEKTIASGGTTGAPFADAYDEAYGDQTREYFDPKERSKERKKNVEANRTDDKRSSAMAMLKAKREGKAKREEEEAKRLAQRRERNEDEIDAHGKPTIKLKASDIYSDDSGSSDSDSSERSNAADARHHNRDDSNDSNNDSADSNDSNDDDDDDNAAPGSKSSANKSHRSASGGASGGAHGTSSAAGGSATSAAPAKRAPTNVPLSTKEEISAIRLSRYKIERFIALPHFDRVVNNCFVRISIGNNNNRPVYRVAEIVGVVETPKIYNLGKSRTNKGLRLRHGTSERVFRLEFISNQDFSDSEFDKWKSECGKYGQLLPTLDFVERKALEIREAIVYEFKEEDVHRIIAEKNRFRKYPTNYAMKKTVLMKERDAALLRGDDVLAADINVQIEELDERANELDKKRSSTISLISYINDRNRKRNVEEAEKAIMEEVRASQGRRTDDPFTRRSTKPTMAFKTGRTAADEAAALLPMGPTATVASTAARNKQQQDAQRQAALAAADNNLYTLHDFEIDLDVTSMSTNAVNVVQKPVARPADAAPKRSLNLEDYKKKRGLI